MAKLVDVSVVGVVSPTSAGSAPRGEAVVVRGAVRDFVTNEIHGEARAAAASRRIHQRRPSPPTRRPRLAKVRVYRRRRRLSSIGGSDELILRIVQILLDALTGSPVVVVIRKAVLGDSGQKVASGTRD